MSTSLFSLRSAFAVLLLSSGVVSVHAQDGLSLWGLAVIIFLAIIFVCSVPQVIIPTYLLSQLRKLDAQLPDEQKYMTKEKVTEWNKMYYYVGWCGNIWLYMKANKEMTVRLTEVSAGSRTEPKAQTHEANGANGAEVYGEKQAKKDLESRGGVEVGENHEKQAEKVLESRGAFKVDRERVIVS